MGDDLIPILTRFHREVVLPDIRRVVGEVVGDLEGRMNAHFDAIDQRFDKLETEYQMLVAALKRVEERLDRVEERLTEVERTLEKVALRSELDALRARVDGLQEQVRTLQARLDTQPAARSGEQPHQALRLLPQPSSYTKTGTEPAAAFQPVPT